MSSESLTAMSGVIEPRISRLAARLLDDHGRMACVVHAVRKQDLELLDVLAASQKNAYPQGTFEGTQIATAAIFTDGEWVLRQRKNAD